jgi:hypothetical protein
MGNCKKKNDFKTKKKLKQLDKLEIDRFEFFKNGQPTNVIWPGGSPEGQ